MKLIEKIKQSIKKEPKYTVRSSLTDDERYEAHQKLAEVMDAICDYEKEHNITVLESARFYEEDYCNEESYKSNRIDFFGVSGTNYTLPLTVFMTIPIKRIVIGVTRALMIGYDLRKS